jgi:hypothetical protein
MNREHYMINWSPVDARKIAELILAKASEAEKVGPEAEVLLRFVTDKQKQRFGAFVSVISPSTRVVIHEDVQL